jgi:shikimate kinase
MKKIILVGYMGSGKTAIGKILSRKLNIKALDLDEIIEKKCNASITDIFKFKGEVYFRNLEHLCFKELMANNEDMILSLGGGTPAYANNHELLNGENTISIYLKSSIEPLFERLRNNKKKRPIIAAMSDAELKEFIAKSLFERSFYYNKAKYKIDIDAKSKEIVADEICQILS